MGVRQERLIRLMDEKVGTICCPESGTAEAYFLRSRRRRRCEVDSVVELSSLSLDSCVNRSARLQPRLWAMFANVSIDGPTLPSEMRCRVDRDIPVSAAIFSKP